MQLHRKGIGLLLSCCVALSLAVVVCQSAIVRAAEPPTHIAAPDVAYQHYTPGTYQVQIPEKLLPPPKEEWVEVPIDYDERVGRVVPGSAAKAGKSQQGGEAPARRTAQVGQTQAPATQSAQQAAMHSSKSQTDTTTVSNQPWRPKPKKPPVTTAAPAIATPPEKPAPVVGSTPVAKPVTPIPAAKPAPSAPAAKAAPLPKTKKIKKRVPAPNPYRMPTSADFTMVNNLPGKYTLHAPIIFGADPLTELPVSGPMTVRTASTVLMCAATVDDPTDTKYYKTQDNFPVPRGATLLLKERRPVVGGKLATVYYKQAQIGGVPCLQVLSEVLDGQKTYRTLWLLPDAQKLDLLAQALYAVETMQWRK